MTEIILMDKQARGTFKFYFYSFLVAALEIPESKMQINHDLSFIKQGSHSTWKPWKNESNFSSHGNIMKFLNFEKYHGKLRGNLEINRISVIVNTLFSF